MGGQRANTGRGSGGAAFPSARAAADRPVHGRVAERLAAIFPDFSIETFPERHHFDPPHRIEPARLADSLLALWQRAEA